MSNTPYKRRRLLALVTPRFIVGSGLLALLTFGYMLVTNTPLVGSYLPGRLVEFFLLGIPAVGLLYTGYWLQTGSFTQTQIWRVGIYAIAAVIVATLTTGVVLSLVQIPQLSVQSSLLLLISVGTEGALLGVLIGVLTVTDVLRSHGMQLEVETEQFRYVERLADICYWEIQSTDSPPYSVTYSEGLTQILDVPADEPFTLENGLRHYHPEDRPRVEAAIERALTEGEPYDIEVRLHTTETDTRWVRSAGEPVTAGDELLKVRGIMQDITDRKQHELELEQQNKRLDEFASLVSHDLRNPLNVATGRLDLAQEDIDNEHLDAVDRALERMETLIDDLRELARTGSEILEPEPERISLAQTLENCWATVDTADASLDVRDEATLEADPSRFQQIFENLFRNAVEHGGPDVTVTVGTLSDESGLYVEDDGDGIPPSKRDAIFDSGYSTTDDGTGLGLNIVNNIVQSHGWDIRVTDGSEGGARFEIRGVESIET